jgi:hypothetical protein
LTTASGSGNGSREAFVGGAQRDVANLAAGSTASSGNTQVAGTTSSLQGTSAASGIKNPVVLGERRGTSQPGSLA